MDDRGGYGDQERGGHIGGPGRSGEFFEGVQCGDGDNIGQEWLQCAGELRDDGQEDHGSAEGTADGQISHIDHIDQACLFQKGVHYQQQDGKGGQVVMQDILIFLHCRVINNHVVFNLRQSCCRMQLLTQLFFFLWWMSYSSRVRLMTLLLRQLQFSISSKNTLFLGVERMVLFQGLCGVWMEGVWVEGCLDLYLWYVLAKVLLVFTMVQLFLVSVSGFRLRCSHGVIASCSLFSVFDEFFTLSVLEQSSSEATALLQGQQSREQLRRWNIIILTQPQYYFIASSLPVPPVMPWVFM